MDVQELLSRGPKYTHYVSGWQLRQYDRIGNCFMYYHLSSRVCTTESVCWFIWLTWINTRFIIISDHTVYWDQLNQLLARQARMDHPLLFRHHHAHQIARQGIDACFIFVRYVNISCINYIKYLFFIYRFQKLLSRRYYFTNSMSCRNVRFVNWIVLGIMYWHLSYRVLPLSSCFIRGFVFALGVTGIGLFTLYPL